MKIKMKRVPRRQRMRTKKLKQNHRRRRLHQALGNIECSVSRKFQDGWLSDIKYTDCLNFDKDKQHMTCSIYIKTNKRNPFTTGLEKSWLERKPEATHINHLVALLNPEESRNLFLALGCLKVKWDKLETEFGKRLEDMHFYALWHWRESAKSATFKVLLETLHQMEIKTCLLCKVVRDIKLEEDFSDEMKAWIPDDEALEDLSHKVGKATFQLGIELGLTVTELENIEHSHKDLMDQTREVLKKWKESLIPKEHESPVMQLAKSLNRVGKYTLVDKLKDHFETEI